MDRKVRRAKTARGVARVKSQQAFHSCLFSKGLHDAIGRGGRGERGAR